MYDVLMEIMEPKIKLREDKLRKEMEEEVRKKVQEEVRKEVQEEVRKEVQEEVRKKDIQGTINILRNLNLEKSKIISEIIKAYKLSENEAEEYL